MSRCSKVISRREMLEKTATAAAVAAVGRRSFAADGSRLTTGGVVLFQGDSITDGGRERKNRQPNSARAMGRGYAKIAAAEMLRDHPGLGLRFFNRGVSGDKVPDLRRRWRADCVELQPALLSILIGVNDIWHRLRGTYDGTVETYRAGFEALMSRTREALPDVALVICEPFVLRVGDVTDAWFPEFDERRAVAREVADRAGAVWVPFQTMFDEAVGAGSPPAYWASDGVHPTMAGHALMAQTWRRIVGI